MIARNQWNVRCRDFGGTDAIDIAAIVRVRVCPDGTDASLSRNGHESGEDSAVFCARCGFQAGSATFVRSRGP
jgi:hypothetical protein